MRMNQVTIPASDIQKSAEFYRRIGFLQIVESDHYARFVSTEGDATFSIYLSDEPVKNPTVVYFENENLDELVLDLKAKGFNFLQDPTNMEYLWREAILEDPVGNKIKLYWAGENRLNPPWRIEKRA